ALATPAAFAAVTATQLPGVGYVVQGSTSVTGAVANNTLTVNPASTSPVVIQWGGSAPAATVAPTINGTGTAGFNIGASATVKFTATKASKTAPILNIDATGNPSMILGTMTAAGSFASPVYVADANGIVVGAGSVINLPAGLGLINADETSSQAQAVFTSGNALPISFQGATGGVTISAGANLASVGGFLLVAGAGNVNVAGAFVSNGGHTAYAINDTTPVTVDAGVGGYFSGTTFTPQDYSAAQTFGSLSTTSYSAGGFVYQDAANSAVNLNLGTTTSPYSATSLSVLADGNVNLASGGDLTQVRNLTSSSVDGSDPSEPGTFDWSGMLTNNGVMDYGDQTGSTLIPTTAYADIYANGNIHANTTISQYGGFDNATSGLVNAGSIYAYGNSFSNAGTLQMGDNGYHPYLSATATKGNINLGGTVDVVGVGSYAGPTALSYLYLDAASTTGQSVTVNTTPLTVGTAGASGYAEIAATNVNLDSSLTVSGGGDFYFYPYSVDNASAAPVSGSFVLASGATLSAQNLHLGTESWNYGPAYTSYKINGSMVATGTAASDGAFLGGSYYYSGDYKASVFNVSGAGSITAGNLTFTNLLGSVNNITTGQILANGFQVNAPTGGAVNISVDAVGSAPQGFNLNVNGNATLNSGGTQAVLTQTPAGNPTYTQYLMPANANSNLVVQTSGNLTVNAGNLGSYGNTLSGYFFQWPGLVYLQANGGQLTSTTAIANAYAAQASTGHAGVFLIGDNIT
ncbi:filamentous hemagglutinin N-terminal domain-containing protein, partial [Acidithiobacillus ferrooxidans]|uniref:beta strand repeat-containing protein n=1 Tax=Acidithiobacillus ferrooxidans TaxID=920 RepID=UPI001C0780DA